MKSAQEKQILWFGKKVTHNKYAYKPSGPSGLCLQYLSFLYHKLNHQVSLLPHTWDASPLYGYTLTLHYTLIKAVL